MENNLSTPHRMIPGVGSGIENSGSVYRSGGHVDGKIEKSPFQRVPLSAMSENRSALLSGVQRVLVKPKDATPVAQQLRSPNNFMKPTESSRVNIGSTPVRARAPHTPSNTNTNSSNSTTPGYAQPLHSAGVDSANLLMHVGPTLHNTPTANPLMTPTRAQSSGRVATRPVQSPGHNTTTTHTTSTSGRKVTPPTVVATVGSARKAGVVRDTETHTTTPNTTSAATSHANTDNQYYDGAAAQLLFSPDQRRSPSRTNTRTTTTTNTTNPTNTNNITNNITNTTTTNKVHFASPPRALSAPRLRPQSLSAQLAAHSEHLNRVARVEGSSPAQVESVRRSPGSGGLSGLSGVSGGVSGVQPTSPVNVVSGTSNVNSGSGGKTKPPTHTNTTHATHTALHTAHTASSAHSTKLVRSADVLSANKAAKKAALALQVQHNTHTTHTTHSTHTTPAGAHTNVPSVARYLQPTHSSAAATTALLVSNTHTNNTNTNNTNTKNKSRIPRPSGIAEELPTPPRSKSAKRGTNTNTNSTNTNSTNANGGSTGTGIPPVAVLRRKDSTERLPKHSPTNNITTKVSADANTSKVNKTHKTSPSGANKPTVGASKSGLKPKTVVSGGVYGGSGTSGGDSSNADNTLNASALLHLLEHNSPNRHISGASNRVYSDRVNMQGLRRSCSFGSELSCVVGEEGLLSLGGSIDFSGNNTFDMEQEPLNFSHRAPTPSIVSGRGSSGSSTGGSSGDMYGGAQGSVYGGSVVSVASSNSITSGVTKQALVTRIRTIPANSTTTNNTRTASTTTANTALTTNTNTVTPTTNKGQLTLQVLEQDLANLSMVEAPASFSPINISMLSNFSQNNINMFEYSGSSGTSGTSSDVNNGSTGASGVNSDVYPDVSAGFVPIRMPMHADVVVSSVGSGASTTNATGLSLRLSRPVTNTYNTSPNTNANTTGTTPVPSELSYIRATSINNLSDNTSSHTIHTTHTPSHTPTHANTTHKWTDEYNAFFPPEITNTNNVSSNSDTSYNESMEQINIVNALNYTGVMDGGDSICMDINNTSSITYAMSPVPHPQHYSSVYGCVGNSTFDPVASQSDALNVGMMRSTNTINTLHTTNTYNASSSVSDVLNTATINSNTTYTSNTSFGIPTLLRPITRQFSDNSVQSCNISAISPCMTNTSVDVERNIVNNIQNMYNTDNMHNITAGNSINRLLQSADSNITNYTYNTHNTFNTYTSNTSNITNTTNVLDRAMIASYDTEHFTTNTDTSIRNTFFPPPAFGERVESSAHSLHSVHSVHGTSDLHSISSNNAHSNVYNNTTSVRESVDWNVMQSVESLPPPPPPMEAYPVHPLHNNVNTTTNTNTNNTVTSANNAANTNTNTSNTSTPYIEQYSPHSEDLIISTSIMDSESDSVLQETCSFAPISGNNTSGSNVDSNGSSDVSGGSGGSGGNSDISGGNSDGGNVVSDSVVVSPTGRNNSTSTTSSIHPTILDTSVDLTQSNNNTLLRQTLPMPAVTATTTTNYLDYDTMPLSAPVVAHTHATHTHTTHTNYTLPSTLPPVLSPSSAELKRQLLEESTRHFNSIRTNTTYTNTTSNGNTNNITSTNTTHTANTTSINHTIPNDMFIRTSYGLSEYAGMPSVGSLRTMSFVQSSVGSDGSECSGDGDSVVSGDGSVVSGDGSAVSGGGSIGNSVHSAHSVHNLPQYDLTTSHGVYETAEEGYDSELELNEIAEQCDDYMLSNNLNSGVNDSGVSGASGVSYGIGGSDVSYGISGADNVCDVNMSMHSNISKYSVVSSVGSMNSVTRGMRMSDSVNTSMCSVLNCSCSYTSSMDELHLCNPACKSSRWVCEHYPDNTNTINGNGSASVVHTTHDLHHMHHKGRPQTPTNFNMHTHTIHTTPNTKANTSTSSGSGGKGIAHSMHTPKQTNTSGHRDGAAYTNSSMVPLAPQSSVILREELNLDQINSNTHTTHPLYTDFTLQSNPDPIARQLLIMDTDMHKMRMQSNMNVFVPVNALLSSTEF